jgi:asparagine synthase (glutamine-hydrolysing)
VYRYITLLWNPHDVDDIRVFNSLASLLARRPSPWSIAYEGSGVLALHTAKDDSVHGAYRLHGEAGIVLGKIFDRTGQHPNRVAGLNRLTSAQIAGTGGRHLIDHFWGAYVAFLCNDSTGEHHIIRGPTDNLPCYYAKFRGLNVIFSHVEDCVRILHLPFTVNREYLVRRLLVGRLLSRDCGLKDVENVQGGVRLTLRAETVTRTLLWNPATLAETPRFEDPADAASALRSTVQSSVNAWSSCYRKIAHKLSGGLDSSIVAGCLAQTSPRPDLTFLHFAIPHFENEQVHLPGIDAQTAAKLRAMTGSGDERYFARLVADKWKVPLLEIARNRSMDLTRVWQGPLAVSPAGYFAAMESDDAQIEFAQKHGAQAFFSGLAGDTVFFTPTQALPAIDFAYLHSVRPKLWKHIVATSMLSKESLWSVTAKAFKHGLLRRPWRSAFSVFDAPTLVKKSLIDGLTESNFSDLWDELPADLPPGKRHHLGSLAGSAHHDCQFHTARYADQIDPLHSQPIWEMVLQTPTYTMLTGGVSRGLARLAFADLLPFEIKRRKSKGAGDPFYQQVVRRNIGFLREHLLDGMLVRDGYLDRKRLEDYLGAEQPFMTVSAGGLLGYLTVEAWLQQWASIDGASLASETTKEPAAI